VGPSVDHDFLIDPEQTLAAAENLVAHQKLADAVQLLTEANRRRRDPGVEKRLVDLRFDAFKQTHWRSERPVSPDCVEDLFPGERIPEIAREQLTVERLRSGIAHHGSLLVRGLADRDQVEQLISDIDKALAAFDAKADGVDRPDLAGWFEPFMQDPRSNRTRRRKRGAVLAVDSPPALFDLVETFEPARVDRLVHDYFGEPPMMLAKKVVLRRVSPRDAKGGGWHQDGAFMGVGIRSLNIWLSLSHCGDDAPGLDVVSRRLDGIVETGGDGTFFAWAANPHVAEKVGAGAIVRPVFEPGDALLLDHLTLHRTAVDSTMQNDRYAIETWLFAPSTYDAMMTKGGQKYDPFDQLPILF
jgi:Phytanoyl-CoA dioxygenase (PhyH)